MTKILVIEDEADIRDELVDWLCFEDYEVCIATDGKQGVDLAIAEKPDLIISDIRMPLMDGREVLMHIRSHPDLSDTPFIFVTASAERDSVRLGMNMGADDYITKPFTVDEILKAVQAQVHKHRQHTEAWEHRVDQLAVALDNERQARLLKSRLVAMFSHDFRNPLALIKSSADLVLNYEDRLSADKRRAKLKQITNAVSLLVQMLDDMLLVAEMENEHFAPDLVEANIVALVTGIVREFREMHETTHTLTMHSEQACINLLFDAKLVRQIMVNILSNAVKYSPDGGEIVVTVEARAEAVCISVRDPGIGIPRSYLPQLFEPFQRADNARYFKGTGLGLAIVKQAVDYLNGAIHVESQEGVGTAIHCLLPSSRPSA